MRQLLTDDAAAALRKGTGEHVARYCPFPVTSLQWVIKTSRAACQGSANSRAEQDPSQEAPAKLQTVAAAAAAVVKAKEKISSWTQGPRIPATGSEL